MQPQGLETYPGACRSAAAVCPARAGDAGGITRCARAAPGPGVSDTGTGAIVTRTDRRSPLERTGRAQGP